MHSFHSILRAFKTAWLSDFSLHRSKQNNCLSRTKYIGQISFACYLTVWRFYLFFYFFLTEILEIQIFLWGQNRHWNMSTWFNTYATMPGLAGVCCDALILNPFEFCSWDIWRWMGKKKKKSWDSELWSWSWSKE